MPTTVVKEQQSAPIPPSTPRTASFRRVLKNRNFVLFWLAQLISLTILNAANFGIIVLVNDVTHSVVMAGVEIIAFTLPAVPFSAVAGVIVDRLNKRLVLWVSNVLRMFNMLLIVVSLLNDQTNLWPLYVLIFMTSLIGQFFIPAESGSIPLLVGERELMPALSLFNITMTLSQAIGYLVLGSIVSHIFPSFTLHLVLLTLHVQSIDLLFVMVAFFYLVCAGLILCISPRKFEEQHLSKHRRNTGEEAGKAIKALWHDIVEGWHFVRNDRMLYFAVIQLSVVGNIMLLIGELAGPFMQQVLHHPAADMGIILAPAAVGLVGASIVMPRITERVGKLRLTVIGFITLAIGFLLLVGVQWLAALLYKEQAPGSALLLWTTMALVFIL